MIHIIVLLYAFRQVEAKYNLFPKELSKSAKLYIPLHKKKSEAHTSSMLYACILIIFQILKNNLSLSLTIFVVLTFDVTHPVKFIPFTMSLWLRIHHSEKQNPYQKNVEKLNRIHLN